MSKHLVNWFEIPVNDMERARKFYETSFEIELSPNEKPGAQMCWFPMDPGTAGATGTLMKADSYEPSHTGSIVYMSVGSIEDTLSRIGANGGKTLMPKMSIGEHGFIAHFEDTEGNRVALHSMS